MDMSCRLKTEELRAQRSKLLAAALLPWFLALAGGAPAQTVTGHTGGTKVILLGTGTPRPFPERSGPATAIVVDDKAYLVDFGPGVIRRRAAAAAQGTPALLGSHQANCCVSHPPAFGSYRWLSRPDFHALGYGP